jgi:hypothetical protein
MGFDKSATSILENIVMDVMEHDNTSISVYCNPHQVSHAVNLTEGFSALLGLHNFYLKAYNEDTLTLKSDVIDGLFDWLLDGTCHSIEINFSTYGNQQEEHCCDTNNFNGIVFYFGEEFAAGTFSNSFKFEPFDEVYKNVGYDVAEVIDLLNVMNEAKSYLTRDNFAKRKLLCQIAGNWKPLLK